jgi:hypothetical protein
MINWTIPALLFAGSAALGAWLDGRLQMRSGWSKRRRIVRAAIPVPLLILALSTAGVLWECLRPPTGSTMTDLAMAVYVGVGGLLALLTLGGGLLGASLVEGKQPK